MKKHTCASFRRSLYYCLVFAILVLVPLNAGAEDVLPEFDDDDVAGCLTGLLEFDYAISEDDEDGSYLDGAFGEEAAQKDFISFYIGQYLDMELRQDLAESCLENVKKNIEEVDEDSTLIFSEIGTDAGGYIAVSYTHLRAHET